MQSWGVVHWGVVHWGVVQWGVVHCGVVHWGVVHLAEFRLQRLHPCRANTTEIHENFLHHLEGVLELFWIFHINSIHEAKQVCKCCRQICNILKNNSLFQDYCSVGDIWQRCSRPNIIFNHSEDCNLYPFGVQVLSICVLRQRQRERETHTDTENLFNEFVYSVNKLSPENKIWIVIDMHL